MPTVKELREKRAPLAREIRRQADAMHASGRTELTAEEQASWQKVNSDYNALTQQIERYEAVERIEAEQLASVGDPIAGREDVRPGKRKLSDGAETAASEEDRTLAMKAWFNAQLGRDLTKKQRLACQKIRFNPRKKEMAFQLFKTRDFSRLQSRMQAIHHSKMGEAADRLHDFRAGALNTVGGKAGGFLIPPETMRKTLEINMLAYGDMWRTSEVLTTKTGERMSWPTADDTGNKAILLGQNTTIGNSVNPNFAKALWDAYKWSTQPILVPYELLEDSEVDLPEVVGELFGVRFGRGTNPYFTTGNGANQPYGIINASTLGITAASSTAIAADEIIRLEHSVDPAYRPDASYMMHDTILLAIRLLKDGEGRYLWQSGLEDGRPDRLNGRPLVINQQMASSVATTNITLLFGNLRYYKIRRVGEIRMYRLEERYRDLDQDGFIAFMRADGNLLTAGTPPLKYLKQP